MRKAVSTLTFVCMLAALGCTTNNNPGNGQPANAPATMPSQTPGASSTGMVSPPAPMASSFTPSERAASTVDAIAILAADQGYRGRVLGAANPPATGPSGNVASAEPLNPAAMLQPNATTVNSSVTSPATPALANDAGLGGGVVATGAVAATGTTAAANMAATAANTTAITAAIPTATIHSQGALPLATATQPIAGTATQLANPAASATVPLTPAAAATTTATTAPIVATPAATTGTVTTSTATARLRTTATGSQSVRVVNQGGRVVVTNVTQHQ